MFWEILFIFRKTFSWFRFVSHCARFHFARKLISLRTLLNIFHHKWALNIFIQELQATVHLGISQRLRISHSSLTKKICVSIGTSSNNVHSYVFHKIFAAIRSTPKPNLPKSLSLYPYNNRDSVSMASLKDFERSINLSGKALLHSRAWMWSPQFHNHMFPLHLQRFLRTLNSSYQSFLPLVAFQFTCVLHSRTNHGALNVIEQTRMVDGGNTFSVQSWNE